MNENTIRKIISLYVKDYYNIKDAIVYLNNDREIKKSPECNGETLTGHIRIIVNREIRITPFYAQINGPDGFRIVFNNP